MSRWFPVLCLVLAALWPPALAESVDEILARNFEARGGLEKLKAVHSVRMKGKMHASGMEMPFLMEWKAPDKIRIEFTLQGMTGIQAYDGNQAWRYLPFMGKTEPEPLTEPEAADLKQQADFLGPLVDYKSKGHKVEYIGQEDVEGTPCHAIRLTKKNGEVSTIYLDADSMLEIMQKGKRTVNGQEVEFESSIGDYKLVDDLAFPYAIESRLVGVPMTQTILLESIELNVSIPDERFAASSATPSSGSGERSGGH